MRLTNTQVNMIAEAFMEKVDKKKSTFLLSKEGEKIRKEVVKELSEADILRKLEKYLSIESKINELRDASSKLREELNTVLRKRIYHNPTHKDIEVLISDEVMARANVPTIAQVRSAIILNDLGKSDDILEYLSNKFKL